MVLKLKTPVFLMILLITFSFLSSEKFRIPELLNPSSIIVSMDKAYIADRASIYIYSLKNFKLIKKFGSEGGGPSEFKVIPGFEIKLFLTDKNIVVESLQKVSVFSLEGNLVKEIKKSNPGRNYFPTGDIFVCRYSLKEKNIQYLVYQFEKEQNNIFIPNKIFFKLKNAYQENGLASGFNPLTQLPLKLLYIENKIFISELSGTIKIFDKTGVELLSIKPNYGKLNVNDKLKEEVFDFYRNNPGTKPIFEGLKSIMVFPDSFPDVRDFYLNDKKIYILPYALKNGKKQFYVYDFHGRLQKKIEAQLEERNILDLFPYAIDNGYIYQLVENEDEEIWELHVKVLKMQ